MDIYWFEQTSADVPRENDWLSVAEQVRLSQFHIPKRRADWRLGRWTAKCAVSAYIGVLTSSPPLATIEICPASSGAPEVVVRNARPGLRISITHRDGTAACVVAPAGAAVGCDLEAIESHSTAFVADYFTREEQRMIEVESPLDRDVIATLLWSAKESALKALATGLRVDTRSVVVSRRGWNSGDNHPTTLWRSAAGNPWAPLEVRQSGGQLFYGWWQRSGGLLRTVVADPPPLRPRNLAVRRAAA